MPYSPSRRHHRAALSAINPADTRITKHGHQSGRARQALSLSLSLARCSALSLASTRAVRALVLYPGLKDALGGPYRAGSELARSEGSAVRGVLTSLWVVSVGRFLVRRGRTRSRGSDALPGDEAPTTDGVITEWPWLRETRQRNEMEGAGNSHGPGDLAVEWRRSRPLSSTSPASCPGAARHRRTTFLGRPCTCLPNGPEGQA